jgi:hypothetical protein
MTTDNTDSGLTQLRQDSGLPKSTAGIPIDVFYQTGQPPAYVWIPEQGVTPYRGRG